MNALIPWTVATTPVGAVPATVSFHTLVIVLVIRAGLAQLHVRDALVAVAVAVIAVAVFIVLRSRFGAGVRVALHMDMCRLGVRCVWSFRPHSPEF